MPWLPMSKVRAMVTPRERRDEVLSDVKALIEQMHARVAPHADDPFFKATALGGPSAWISRG
jgi:hypothetical protein